ncbi:MAG TPA: bifunctional metallophosphatase/5'-nucleotidase [Candidatus Marinimicrobia bacterium]|nr:bifunctional metallophosphatase/5'-nucleotidase [Candidatus Neomarinimicrobiota bacterium]
MKFRNSILILTLLFVMNLGANEGLYNATFIHWNDFHSWNMPWKPTHYNPDGHIAGGYAYLASMIDSLKSIYPDAFVVHAGDDFQGTPVSSITRGGSQIAILNEIKPDFFTVGNHEFDYGLARLLELRDTAEFDMYAANIRRPSDGARIFKSVRVLDHLPFKAAAIGLTSGELYLLCLPSNLENLILEDPVETALHLTDSLMAEGYDFIVAVTHMGIENDIELARKVPAIDLIIGGHSHTYMRNPRKEGNTFIVQASSSGRYLGELHINTDGKTIQSVNHKLLEVLPSQIKASPTIAAIVDKYENQAGEMLNQVIGELKSDWIRGGMESNLGNWITDAMRVHTKAHIAVQNNGGIRKNLSAGPIKVRDMWEIVPFENQIITFTVTGEEIETMLSFQIASGFSVQWSGITFEADTVNNIAKNIRIKGKRLKAQKSYTVASNNYVAEQLDKYFGIEKREVKEFNLIDRDVLIEAVKKQKVINSKKEGRIVIKNT